MNAPDRVPKRLRNTLRLRGHPHMDGGSNPSGPTTQSLSFADLLCAPRSSRKFTEVGVSALEKQRPRQPVLQAAGRMRAFVLQIDRDAPQTAEGGLDQMRIGGAPSVALQQVDRLLRPIAVNPGGSSGTRSGQR